MYFNLSVLVSNTVRITDKSHVNKSSLGTKGPGPNALRIARINTGMGRPGTSPPRGNRAPGNAGSSLGEDLWAKAQGLATEVSTGRPRGQSSALHACTGQADKEMHGRRQG